MKAAIPDFSKARVLVIGDVMLDRYWHGDTSRISPEAPVAVVSVRSSEDRPGGAGNAALNIAALGAHVELVGIIGQDEQGTALLDNLRERRVHCNLITSRMDSTVTKIRTISRQQQMIRQDFESDFSNADHVMLKQLYAAALLASQVVVISDYGKGTLTDVQELIAWAHAHDKPVFVDPKGNDYSRYRRADLVKPNQAEFEAVVGACRTDDEIVEKGTQLLQALEIGALLITRGGDGMLLLRADHEPVHFRAIAREIYDITGAGDTVIAVTAAGLAAGLDLPKAVELANLAAGIVVGKLGAATVTVDELMNARPE